VLASGAALLPVKRAALFMQNSPLGGTLGSDFYSAPNPPFGATFTYYLKDAIKTKKEVRQAADQAAAKKHDDVFYPPWDSLKAENDERPPELIFTITDAEGRVVRRLMDKPQAGVQRVTWDLRYASLTPVSGAGKGGNGGDGPLVAPGTYHVAMASLVDGVETALGAPQSFDVYLLDGSATPRTAAVVAFQEKTARLQRAVLGANAAAGEAATRLRALRQALLQTPTPTDSLMRRAQALEDTLRAIQETLGGDQTRARYSEPVPPSLLDRLGNVTDGLWFSTLEDATNTQKRQYDIIASQFGAILSRLRQFIDVDLHGLETAAEAAGAPWTPGRIPAWQGNG
ncbi:MAG: glycosyl hydrolase, partial [Gemmatimonadota bacterium]|nr:glycosyl hydrolase [Gemmatimonadota bacterium]